MENTLYLIGYVLAFGFLVYGLTKVTVCRKKIKQVTNIVIAPATSEALDNFICLSTTKGTNIIGFVTQPKNTSKAVK